MIDTQNQSDIASRLRCKYPVGPIGDNGEPEFGWRDFSGPAPKGMVLPTQIMLDAADTIDAQTAEIAGLKSQVEMLEACAAGDAALTEGQQREIALLREAQAWRPVETAPKDGSSVILRSRGGHIADGYWLQAAFNGCGAWIWPYVHSEPAHWMPLPAAPDALSGESK